MISWRVGNSSFENELGETKVYTTHCKLKAVLAGEVACVVFLTWTRHLPLPNMTIPWLSQINFCERVKKILESHSSLHGCGCDTLRALAVPPQRTMEVHQVQHREALRPCCLYGQEQSVVCRVHRVMIFVLGFSHASRFPITFSEKKKINVFWWLPSTDLSKHK